jgi:uncharacterized protein YndB with AHSA1/START domain
MENQYIQKTIEINAPIQQVWKVFTDPEITKQLGGYYETDWKVGSSFGFRRPDGTVVTNGKLLEFQPMRIIRHSLFDEATAEAISEVTYTFEEDGTQTVLTGREDMAQPLDDAAYDDAVTGWEEALSEVKRIAEEV